MPEKWKREFLELLDIEDNLKIRMVIYLEGAPNRADIRGFLSVDGNKCTGIFLNKDEVTVMFRKGLNTTDIKNGNSLFFKMGVESPEKYHIPDGVMISALQQMEGVLYYYVGEDDCMMEVIPTSGEESVSRVERVYEIEGEYPLAKIFITQDDVIKTFNGLDENERDIIEEVFVGGESIKVDNISKENNNLVLQAKNIFQHGIAVEQIVFDTNALKLKQFDIIRAREHHASTCLNYETLKKFAADMNINIDLYGIDSLEYKPSINDIKLDCSSYGGEKGSDLSDEMDKEENLTEDVALNMARKEEIPLPYLNETRYTIFGLHKDDEGSVKFLYRKAPHPRENSMYDKEGFFPLELKQ